MWSYNQSSVCPQDANGNTLGEVMAQWLSGSPVPSDANGVLFDADPYVLDVDGDYDNDLAADPDWTSPGIGVWGEGMQSFYSAVRDELTSVGKDIHIIVGGWIATRGFVQLNGIQEESLFDDTSDILEDLDDYRFHVHRHE